MSKANRLMTKALETKMTKNFKAGEGTMDTVPCVKLFTPDAGATWFFSEYDPVSRCFFGLCDLGLGYPEMGYASRDELEALTGRLGLHVEREMYGKPTKTYNELLGDMR